MLILNPWFFKIYLYCMRYQCGDLLLARTLCLVYSECKIELCVCLVVYGSLTMYHRKEQTSDGFPCMRLYNTGLFSPCLVIFLVRAFCYSRLYTLVVNTPTTLDIFKFKKNFSQRYFRHQATVWWNSLPSTLFDDISNFRDGLLHHLLDHDCPKYFLI